MRSRFSLVLRVSPALVALAALTSAPRAIAQPARQPRQQPQPTTQPLQTTPAPTPALPGASSGSTPIDIPPPPSVDDPMLQPMTPAPRDVGSWDEALQLIRARSTDLRIAYDEVRRAEAQSRIALAGTLPSLNGTAAATHQLITRTSTQFIGLDPATNAPISVTATTPLQNVATGSLVLSQPLFAPRVWHAIGTAHRNEEAAALSVSDAKRNIALGVASALIGVVTNERIAELNRVGLRQSLERLELTQRKMNLGAATGLDVVRVQQDVESARATLVTGDEALRQAREALGLTLGLPQQLGVTSNISLDGMERSAMSACRATPSLEARADVAAARKRFEVAQRNVDDVKLQFSPTITASSALSTTTADTGAAPSTTWNIQGILSVPFWEGGARYGALRSARVDADEAEANLVALRRNATVQVEQAHRAVKVAEDSRLVASNARQLAAETDRLTRASYTEGKGTSLELVTAAAALRSAEINLALKDFDLVRARVLSLLALADCPW